MLYTKFDKHHVVVEDFRPYIDLVCTSSGEVINKVFAIDTLYRCVHVFRLDDTGDFILNSDGTDCLKMVLELNDFELTCHDKNPPEVLIKWS